MKKQIALLITAAGALTAFADDSALTAQVKYPWESSVAVGLTLTRGNSDTLLATANFLTQKKTPTDEFSIGLGGEYGDQSGKDTVNDYKAFGQWNHLFTEKFYGYVRADALRDVIANLDYRFVVGPGAGYYLIKDGTNTTLAVEAGGAFEAQHFNGKSDDDFMTVRFAERFEHKFSAGARVWEMLEYLPQIDKWDNNVINFEVGAEAALTKSFSLRAVFDDTYQNEPAPGKLKNDAKIIAAIAYKF